MPFGLILMRHVISYWEPMAEFMNPVTGAVPGSFIKIYRYHNFIGLVMIWIAPTMYMVDCKIMARGWHPQRGWVVFQIAIGKISVVAMAFMFFRILLITILFIMNHRAVILLEGIVQPTKRNKSSPFQKTARKNIALTGILPLLLVPQNRV